MFNLELLSKRLQNGLSSRRFFNAVPNWPSLSRASEILPDKRVAARRWDRRSETGPARREQTGNHQPLGRSDGRPAAGFLWSKLPFCWSITTECLRRISIFKATLRIAIFIEVLWAFEIESILTFRACFHFGIAESSLTELFWVISFCFYFGLVVNRSTISNWPKLEALGLDNQNERFVLVRFMLERLSDGDHLQNSSEQSPSKGMRVCVSLKASSFLDSPYMLFSLPNWNPENVQVQNLWQVLRRQQRSEGSQPDALSPV